MNWLNVPHIKQRQQADCLAACVAMVAAYQNQIVRYKTLLKTLQISKYGAPSSNLKRLTRLGWHVVYEEYGTLETLKDAIAIDKPPIVFVQTDVLPYWVDDTGHAVVVVGVDDEHVYLHDPAVNTAPQPVSHDAFMLAWSEFGYDYAIVTVTS